MTREEIKAQIVEIISANWIYFDDDTEEPTAEKILQFLESEVKIYKNSVVVYATSDPSASWNNPK